MTLLEFGTTLDHRGEKRARSAKGSKAQNAIAPYDKLAGSTLMRRTGKAAGAAPLRGDQRAALLASRRANDADGRLGRELADYYEAILRQPVPERILALVEALAAQQAG